MAPWSSAKRGGAPAPASARDGAAPVAADPAARRDSAAGAPAYAGPRKDSVFGTEIKMGGRLRIHLSKATNLRAADAGGTSDPYIVCECGGQIEKSIPKFPWPSPFHRQRE